MISVELAWQLPVLLETSYYTERRRGADIPIRLYIDSTDRYSATAAYCYFISIAST